MGIADIINIMLVMLAATFIGEFIITELVDLYISIREKLKK